MKDVTSMSLNFSCCVFGPVQMNMPYGCGMEVNNRKRLFSGYTDEKHRPPFEEFKKKSEEQLRFEPPELR